MSSKKISCEPRKEAYEMSFDYFTTLGEFVLQV
jgi:hypothetical protein